MSKLEFPSHFPPSDPWKKFFIGVRWLGPDLSFFATLKQEQGERQLSCMSAWHYSGREIATAIGLVLSRSLGWRSPYFLPEDMVEVAFHGPSFDFTDPESAFEEIVEMLAERFAIRPSEEFWRSQAKNNLGQLVDGLLAQSAA